MKENITPIRSDISRFSRGTIGVSDLDEKEKKHRQALLKKVFAEAKPP